MTVTPRDNGFLVYVKREGKRYRYQAQTEAQGYAMEREILDAIEAGREPDPSVISAVSTSGKRTLGQVRDLAAANRWNGTKSGATALLNARIVVDIIGKDKPVEDVDDEDVDAVVSVLLAKGNSWATINRKMSALRTMLKLAHKRKWLAELPDMPHRKEGAGRIKFFTDADLLAIAGRTAMLGKDTEADLWVFLADTGARVSEALQLEWTAITATHGTFWKTKNDLPRTIPLTKRVQAMMVRRRDQSKPFDITYDQARGAWDRVKTLLNKDADGEWVIHTLRHTCASRLVQRGVALLVVKEWLGHKSIQQTMRYAHLAPANLDAAVHVLDAAE